MAPALFKPDELKDVNVSLAPDSKQTPCTSLVLPSAPLGGQDGNTMLGLRGCTDQVPETVPSMAIVKNNRVMSSRKA